MTGEQTEEPLWAIYTSCVAGEHMNRSVRASLKLYKYMCSSTGTRLIFRVVHGQSDQVASNVHPPAERTNLKGEEILQQERYST